MILNSDISEFKSCLCVECSSEREGSTYTPYPSYSFLINIKILIAALYIMPKSFRGNLAGNTFILAFLLVASLGASPVVFHIVKDEG